MCSLIDLIPPPLKPTNPPSPYMYMSPPQTADTSYMYRSSSTGYTVDLPQLRVGLCPDRPIINGKYFIRNTFDTPNLPNIIA